VTSHSLRRRHGFGVICGVPPPYPPPHAVEGRVGAVAGTSPATTLAYDLTTLVYDLKQTKSALIYVKYVGGSDLSVVAAVRRRGLNQLKSAPHGRAALRPR
jgi:hypothetical protein